jgi:hypothetical protein
VCAQYGGARRLAVLGMGAERQTGQQEPPADREGAQCVRQVAAARHDDDEVSAKSPSSEYGHKLDVFSILKRQISGR